MIEVSIPEMMEAGGHFGHQTKRWNPKMRQYIYGARSGVHIIDLQRTKNLANEALKVVTNMVAAGKEVLFVGTKQQAREIIKDSAVRAKQHYVNQRWMGGTLTNFKTIKKSIDRLIDLQKKRTENSFEGYSKRELLEVDRTIIKLEASLGGIKALKGLPHLVFIVDPKQEHIAVQEARKLGIPVMAVTDTNCNPEIIDYIIPGNDDAIQSIQYFTKKVTDACLQGLEQRERTIREGGDTQRSDDTRSARKARVSTVESLEDKKGTKGKTAYVGRAAQNTYEGEALEGFSAKADQEKAQQPAVKTEGDEGAEDEPVKRIQEAS